MQKIVVAMGMLIGSISFTHAMEMRTIPTHDWYIRADYVHNALQFELGKLPESKEFKKVIDWYKEYVGALQSLGTNYISYTNEYCHFHNQLVTIQQGLKQETSVQLPIPSKSNDFFATVSALSEDQIGKVTILDFNQTRVGTMLASKYEEAKREVSRWYMKHMISVMGGILGSITAIGCFLYKKKKQRQKYAGELQEERIASTNADPSVVFEG